MAEKRMLSKSFINSAKFMKMSDSAKMLYVYLNVNADDDGIVEVFPFSQMLGTPNDDVQLLVTKGFVCFLNEDWLAFLPHWLQNQYIRQDRYSPSIYHNEVLNNHPEYFDRLPMAKKERILDKKQTVALNDDLFEKWYTKREASVRQEDDLPQGDDGTWPTQLRLGQNNVVEINLNKNNIDESSQDEKSADNLSNLLDSVGKQIISEQGTRFTYNQKKKFIRIIFEMKDSVEREMKVSISHSMYTKEFNKMLTKLFRGMDEILSRGEELSENAYVNKVSRNFWMALAEKNKRVLENLDQL